MRLHLLSLAAALLGLAALCTPAGAHTIVAPGKSAVAQVVLAAGTTATEIPFAVEAIDEGRLKVQLRVTIADARVSLVDPRGRVVIAADDRRIVVQRRNETARPELGDLVLLPEQSDPMPGTWHLRLAHRTAPAGQRAIVTFSLLERFKASLLIDPARPDLGGEALLRLVVTDNGQPLRGLAPRISVSIDGRPRQTIQAMEGLRAPSGISLSNEPGVYLARYAVAETGHVEFVAKLDLIGRRGPLTRTATAAIDAGPAEIALGGVRSDIRRGAGGCVEAIAFVVDITVQRAGTYTVALFPGGVDPSSLRATRTASAGEKLSYLLPLRLDTARRLGEEEQLTRIGRIDVLRFDDQGATLVLRTGPVDASPAAHRRELCR